ncbi:hypothetical protein [Pantoea agglomerans]|uniref:hypothetical protein n=1 Tax=Enterobacter agglomerans TaxID=549 RepID=UPI000E216692|nr:hypothetical protein [Pantoea agglomerans]NKE96736.1 hypothetical protein [Pantoea agglomerans]TRO70090.1 hypothetical protein E5140_21620 [Pantoea agglomerans]
MKTLIKRWLHPDSRDHLSVVLIAVMLAGNLTVSALTMREGLPSFPGFPGWQVWRLALFTSPVIVLLAYLVRELAGVIFWVMAACWLMLAAYYLFCGIWYWVMPVPNPKDILLFSGLTICITYFFTLLLNLLDLT